MNMNMNMNMSTNVTAQSLVVHTTTPARRLDTLHPPPGVVHSTVRYLLLAPKKVRGLTAWSDMTGLARKGALSEKVSFVDPKRNIVREDRGESPLLSAARAGGDSEGASPEPRSRSDKSRPSVLLPWGRRLVRTLNGLARIGGPGSFRHPHARAQAPPLGQAQACSTQRTWRQH